MDDNTWNISFPALGSKFFVEEHITLNALAKEIYYAKGYTYDCESCAVGSIVDAGTKINVSYVAFRFYMNYNRDLMSYLKSFLETNDWVTLNETYKKLPTENKPKSMVVDEIIIVKE